MNAPLQLVLHFGLNNQRAFDLWLITFKHLSNQNIKISFLGVPGKIRVQVCRVAPIESLDITNVLEGWSPRNSWWSYWRRNFRFLKFWIFIWSLFRKGRQPIYTLGEAFFDTFANFIWFLRFRYIDRMLGNWKSWIEVTLATCFPVSTVFECIVNNIGKVLSWWFWKRNN